MRCNTATGLPPNGRDGALVEHVGTAHFVDVSDTMDAAVQSLGAHRAYLDGLGGDFDADQFLRSNAARSGADVGCGYAVTLRTY